MLKEIAHISQIAGEPRRRWFEDEDLELFTWQDEGRNLVGFELCYDKRRQQRSLRWEKPGRYGHYRVNDGEERPGKSKACPILLYERGGFDRSRVAQLFLKECGALEDRLAQFILAKILQSPSF